jgi:hypothetical protein
MPSSAWTLADGRVQALTWETDGGSALRTFGVAASGLVGLERAPAAALHDESARAVALADGRVVTLDVENDALVVRPAAGPTTRLPMRGGVLVDARALALDEGRVIAILVSRPSRVIAVRLDAAGSVTAMGALPIDAPVRDDPRLLSRSLLPFGARRLIVATTERVLAIEVAVEGATVRLARDEGFAGEGVHAPIDGPVP